MGNGETYDFDVVPTAVGDLRVEVTSATGVLQASLAIRVTPSKGAVASGERP